MKFWELISAFTSENEILKNVFEKNCWKKYKIQFEKYNTLVSTQNRDILDEEVPFQLVKEVCELSKQKFYLNYKNTPHHLSSQKRDDETDNEQLGSSEVLNRFGGHFIEEINEKGSAYVTPKLLEEKIEVLGVLKLKNIGIMAFLRTEKGQLKINETITSLDEKRKWIVLEEPFKTADSENNQKKRDHQIRQGIRLYKILPLNGSGKPKETELLKIDTKQKA